MSGKHFAGLTTALTPGYSDMMRGFQKAFYSSSSYEASVPKEYDNSRREVNIWLCCRGVSSSSNNDVGGNILAAMNIQYSHWSLAFQFEDESVRVIEGVNEDDKLQPSYCKYFEDNCIRVKHLDTRTMSPTEVRALVVENALNGSSYLLGSNNCQTWVNEILEKLGLKPIADTLSADVKWKAAALYAGAVNPVAGAAVLGAQQIFKILQDN